MNDLMKVFLIVAGVFVVGAHPATIGNILAGVLHEAFNLVVCIAKELRDAAGGAMVAVAVIFAFMLMFKGTKGSKSSGGKGSKKK